MRIYLIDELFEVRARNEQSARNKAEKKLGFAIRTIVDVTDEIETTLADAADAIAKAKLPWSADEILKREG